MKLVFLSNFFNHHQKFVSDELYGILGNDYVFVETEEVPEDKIQLGYHQYKEPYVLRYNVDTKDYIDKLILEADIVHFGEAPVGLIKKRVSEGKLVVRDDERRYKSLIKYLKWPIYTYNSLFFNNGLLLCSSAFAPRDYLLSGMKPSHCYKWGYFPEIREYSDIHKIIRAKRENIGLKQLDVSILWVARLIGLKHPEAAIFVAKRLVSDGIKFEMNIIGIGLLESKIKRLIHENGLSEYVHMLGSMSPEGVRDYMEKSDIFLFTSDQNEGWGATLNESMNSGCAVVAGHLIGSVPFLLKDGENGMIFKSKNWNHLYEKVKWLVYHKEQREEMGVRAYKTLLNEWSPKVAARNLVAFYIAKLKGKETPFLEGPCSKAQVIGYNWMRK